MAGHLFEDRIKRALRRPPLSQMSAAQHEELRAFVGEASVFEDLPGKWQAAIVAAEGAEGSRQDRRPSSGHCCD